MGEYARTLQELKTKAIRFWPMHLRERVALVSILPLLLKTQDKFLSVLILADAHPQAWKEFVDKSPEMAGSVFLKHLMVLSDLGWETLRKLLPLEQFFPDGEMRFVWQEATYSYTFQAYLHPTAGYRVAPQIAPPHLAKKAPLSSKMEDLIMLLLFGGSSIGNMLPEGYKEKCQIGSLIGLPELLQKFVKENYIRVSTQMRGQTSNALGQLAQNYVQEILAAELQGWKLRSGRIPGISHDDRKTETSFDLVALSPNNRYFAIEVGFQETTNSVIERKAGQAQARAALLHEKGYYICYVLDGAGNMDYREPACKIICDFSDCTVAFSEEEIRHLAKFLRETDTEENRNPAHGALE